MLSTLALHLDLSDLLDACCLAAACFALWRQVHLGEILSSWKKSFKPLSIACHHHLSCPFNANSSHKCHLPFTKISKSCGEDIVICRQNNFSNPISTISIHLSINQVLANLPLFSYHSEKGWHCLTRKRFLACCNSIWSFHNIPTTSGHSFHIRGTTEFLLAGVPPNVVKTLSCWSSDAFLHYWHSLNCLTPLHIESLPVMPSARGLGVLPLSHSCSIVSSFGLVSSSLVHSTPWLDFLLPVTCSSSTWHCLVWDICSSPSHRRPVQHFLVFSLHRCNQPKTAAYTAQGMWVRDMCFWAPTLGIYKSVTVWAYGYKWCAYCCNE